MLWSDSMGYITLNITRADATVCSHPGPCDADVNELKNKPSIKRQIARLSADKVRDCLREYGAWDAAELSNHDDNLSRILWIACCDIAEKCYLNPSH